MGFSVLYQSTSTEILVDSLGREMSTDSVNVLEAFQHAKQDCFETPVSDRGCELWKYDIRGGGHSSRLLTAICRLS